MPIYEYECGEHGRFEIISLKFDRQAERCCPKCFQPAPSVVSLCSMKPDAYWSGVYDKTTGQTFTSSSYRDRWMKDRNKVVVEKGMEKETQGLTKEERMAKVQAKSDKELERVVADEVMKI